MLQMTAISYSIETVARENCQRFWTLLTNQIVVFWTKHTVLNVKCRCHFFQPNKPILLTFEFCFICTFYFFLRLGISFSRLVWAIWTTNRFKNMKWHSLNLSSSAFGRRWESSGSLCEIVCVCVFLEWWKMKKSNSIKRINEWDHAERHVTDIRTTPDLAQYPTIFVQASVSFSYWVIVRKCILTYKKDHVSQRCLDDCRCHKEKEKPEGTLFIDLRQPNFTFTKPKAKITNWIFAYLFFNVPLIMNGCISEKKRNRWTTATTTKSLSMIVLSK